MPVHQLDRDEARRIAVRAQLLDGQRPGDLLEVVDRLTMLQLDPTAAIAPSAHLVAWGRLGAAYDPDHLQRAVDRDRALFEHRATIRPMADLRLYLPQMARAPRYEQARAWLEDNASFREDILALLRDSGPLLSRDVPDTSQVPWPSTGWTNNRNDSATDPMMVGEDAAIDVEAEPDRWLRFDRTGSRKGWRDMAAFAARQHDAALRERLERAIEGKGAFRRFRDLVHDEDLAEQWYAFSTDRQMGRAREFLADEGVRVG